MTAIGYHLIDPKQINIEERVRIFIYNSSIEQNLVHKFLRLETAGLMAQHLDAEHIFSYLSISWRTFPFFVSLRALNPQSRIVHVNFTHSGHPDFSLENEGTRSNSLRRCTYALFDRMIVANQDETYRFKAAALASEETIGILEHS